MAFRPFHKASKPLNPPETRSAPVPLIALSEPGRARWGSREPGAQAVRAYADNPVSHRCIRLVVEAAASVPLIACAEDGGPPPETLCRLIEAADGDQAWQSFLEGLYGDLQLCGEAFVEAVSWEDGRISGLARRSPSGVEPVVDRSGALQGWKIRTRTGHRSVLPDRSGWSPILRIALFAPDSAPRGTAPLTAASRAVEIHSAGAGWAKALIDNAARPSGALVFRQENAALTPDQFDRLKEQLETAHTGAGNAGRPLLLEGGLDWKPMGLTPTDMDFIEARREAAREIALAFGVPPMLLGIPGDNTYANYKEANLAFWRMTVLPLVGKVGDTLSHWLAPKTNGKGRFAPDLDAVPALAPEREAMWRKLAAADFLTREEKRLAAGYPAVPQ